MEGLLVLSGVEWGEVEEPLMNADGR